MNPPLLALDFGGTKHSAAIALPGERTWRALQRAPAPPQADAHGDLAAMLALADSLLEGERPAAVGVSFGGPVDAGAGIVRLSHHVPGWENFPLRESLQARYDAPVSVDNDANVAALGEHRYGAGQCCDSLLYVTVSTGVGGGWILNGQIWRGAGGMAGEIGHTVVDPNGPLCLCGKRGCVERLASGPYLAAEARASLAAQTERGAILHRLAHGDVAAVTAQLVAAAAAQGDELAWEALKRAAWALGVGIGNAANLINPQRFILGGGVAKSGEHYWEVVRQTAHLVALPQVQFDIVPAALGDDAPLWGAIALCLPHS
jgi:glucokinase